MSVGQTSSETSPLNDQNVLNLVRHLEFEGRVVDVVRLTEKWGYGRALPREGMLSAARALLSLRLMDRALGRLRALTDANPDDVEALLLTAELMMERGWTARGMKSLAHVRTLSDHPQLEELTALAEQPPQEILARARAIERSGSHPQLLRLAEVYLATGSLLRGKNLLEQLRRKRPDDDRVVQLLWAARGDLAPRPGPLLQLFEELSDDADKARSEEWEQADRTESLASSDVTMSGVLPPEPLQSAGFPRLFRRPDEEGEGEPAEEVTIAAHMASSTEMLAPPPEEITESGLLDDDPDTRIMEIITNRRDDAPPAGAAESSRGQAVDLRALHEQADPETDMGEDDDIIVMKSSREPAPPLRQRTVPTGLPEPSTARRRPIEVIEKHPVPEPQPEPPPPSAPPDPVILPPPPVVLDDDDLILRPQGMSPLLVIGGAALIAALGVGGVYYGMRAQAGRQIASRTASVLAEGDFATLRGLEVQLTRQVIDEQPPLAQRAAALALIESVLWSEYTGDIADRDDALSALEIAREAGAEPPALALSQGILALSSGDEAAATDFATAAPLDDEARYLSARIALAQGDTDRAAAAWPSPPPAGERYAVVGARLAGESAFTIEGAPLEVQLIAHEQRWGELQAPGRLEAVAALLSGASRQLSPRQRARLYAVSAELNEELGRENLARVSWEKALGSGPIHPRYLYAVASREIANGESVVAVTRLEQCQALFLGERGCQRALVAGLLELDRLDRAAEAAGSDPLLRAWVATARGEAVEIPTTSLDAEAGLASYLQGLQAAAASDTDAADGALESARDALSASPASELRHLSARALAALVEHGSPRAAARRARELQALGSNDPSVQVHFYRYLISVRRRTDAAQYLSHATLLAGQRQDAPALYALGELLRDTNQPVLAESQWQRYLALEPSGPRAEAARAAVEQ
jgi:hypothetical protein